MSLSNKAMLVNLSISQWTGKKIDRRANETVERTHLTEGKVGLYSKRLLPNTKELDTINNTSQAMRKFFYDNTLPWFSDGSRIIKASHYMEFTNKFREYKEQFDKAVREFIQSYPALREQAKRKLGDLYNESDYPSDQEIQYTFNVNVSFMPVPDVGDFRTEILDSEKDEFLNKMKEVEVSAVKECWHKLYDVVNKAVGKLKVPDAIFRDSLIENIQDVCTLLPKLNVTDDTELDSMRKELENTLSGISPDAVRSNLVARHDAAKKLEELSSKMDIFMAG